MEVFVLDASVALSWCFEDEKDKTTIELLDKIENYALLVPEIWTLEVGNALLMAERRKRFTYAEVQTFLNLLKELNIEVDYRTSKKGFTDILNLARANHLTTYDAAYLELALRLDIPLATKDIALQKAAKNLGVEIF
jgi:predicted nucleic acid-binding protein